MKTSIRRKLALTAAAVITMTSFASCGAESEDMANGGNYRGDTYAPSYNNNSNVMGETTKSPQGTTANTTTGVMDMVVEDAVDMEMDGTAGNYFTNEEYNPIVENEYIDTYIENLSTFSVDVDTASYSNFRRMLEYGYIDPDSIRIEEFINYFDYDYKLPEENLPFSVNIEYSDCPWNDEAQLVSIGLKAPEIDMSQREAMNVVFLIDVSGSMYDYNKLPLAQKAFDLLAEGLNENDRVSIVTYAGSDQVVLEGAKGSDYMTIADALYSLEAGGSTAGAAGINTAYEIAQKYFIEGGNNRVILATDGDLNVGVSSEEGLKALIEEKREDDIFLSVLGFGMGNYKDNKLEALADNGNGNYAYIDSEFEAKRVLVSEMGSTLYTVAKDVKIQVDFNEENVKSYRLVGYENRLLNNEDFTDDTKDAGEIGAGHRVTALYEIIPTENQTDSELLTVSVRYKEPLGDTSTQYDTSILASEYTNAPSDNFIFASNIAGMAMLLRDSKYNVSFSLEDFADYLNDADLGDDLYRKELRDYIIPAVFDYLDNDIIDEVIFD
mgnify:CR=1 FL=1